MKCIGGRGKRKLRHVKTDDNEIGEKKEKYRED